MTEHEEIRRIIEHNTMQGHLDRLKSDQSDQYKRFPNDYMSLVNDYMKKNPDVSKAQAMRAITAKHPEAHELWLDSVQKS